MDDDKGKEGAMDSDCPRKLNFDAPLLSTKRLGSSNILEFSSTASLPPLVTAGRDRVPFSWEQVPGKPKDWEKNGGVITEFTPRPKLPPSWRGPPIEEHRNKRRVHAPEAHHSGSDGDEAFSDAMDAFSLSEAIDVLERAQKAEEDDGLKLKLRDSNTEAIRCPNFMIERFLPDATALAASSALKFSRNTRTYSSSCSGGRSVLRSTRQPDRYPSPKGCGLDILFPWRLKQSLRAVKSPDRKRCLNLHHASKHRKP